MLPTPSLRRGECVALSRRLAHTRTISHVEFAVTDGVMPSWPVVLLMRTELLGCCHPNGPGEAAAARAHRYQHTKGSTVCAFVESCDPRC